MTPMERIIRIALLDADLERSEQALDNRVNNCRKWREIAGRGLV